MRMSNIERMLKVYLWFTSVLDEKGYPFYYYSGPFPFRLLSWEASIETIAIISRELRGLGSVPVRWPDDCFRELNGIRILESHAVPDGKIALCYDGDRLRVLMDLV